MSSMFYVCSNLTELVLPSGFGQKAEEMEKMFDICTSLTSLSIPTGFGREANNMDDMFKYCWSLTSLALPEDCGGQAEEMGNMFDNCSSLASVSLPENFGLRVHNASLMFYNCQSLSSIALPSRFGLYGPAYPQPPTPPFWGPPYGQRYYNMFEDCFSLETFVAPEEMFNKDYYELSGMFKGCRSLRSVDFSKSHPFRVCRAEYMFKDCSSLRSIDISTMQTVEVHMFSTWSTPTDDMFTGCNSLSQITYGSEFNFLGASLPEPLPPYQSWQAVGTGTVEKPTGKAYSPRALAADIARPGTYVLSTKVPDVASSAADGGNSAVPVVNVPSLSYVEGTDATGAAQSGAHGSQAPATGDTTGHAFMLAAALCLLMGLIALFSSCVSAWRWRGFRVQHGLVGMHPGSVGAWECSIKPGDSEEGGSHVR